MATARGVDMSDIGQVRRLKFALEYCEARLRTKKLRPTNLELAEEMGLHEVKNPLNAVEQITRDKDMIAIASEIVGEAYLSKLVGSDARMEMLESMRVDYTKALQNQLRMAKGEKDPRTGLYPPERDQVSAFNAISQAKIGEMYIKSVFMIEEDGESEELAHLQKRAELKAMPILRLETTAIDGEVVTPKVQEPVEI